MHDWRHDRYKKWGKIFCGMPPIWGDGVMLTTLEPKDVEHILSAKDPNNFQNYVKGEELQNFLSPLLGNGIFLADHAHTEDGGASWKLQRKVAAGIFTGNQFKIYMTDIFREHSSTCLDILGKSAKEGGTLDMVPMFYRSYYIFYCVIRKEIKNT
jgi:hypothetical protein